jgi:ssDNA-binding Zn-finger/Zn-ribbon topoisomerase 1
MNQPDEPTVPPILPEPCPKCGAPVGLHHWQGRFYTRCQGAGCRFGFDADALGRSIAPCPRCGKGRLKTTPRGQVCADCGSWNDAAGDRPPRPRPAFCPACRGALRVVWTRRGKWAYRCDPCDRWMDT